MDSSSLIYVIPFGNNQPSKVTLDHKDPTSRYWTYQLQVQTLGTTKMVKSVFVNIHQVAKTMQIPPNYILHFLGYENSARAEFNPKKHEKEQASLTGGYDVIHLSKQMEKLISEIVSCPKCGLPELTIFVDNNSPSGMCRSCSFNGTLPISNPKFKNFIVKNPPASSGGEFNGQVKVQKKQPGVRKDKKEKETKKKEDDSFTEFNHKEEEVVWFSDTSEEATRKRMFQLGVNDPSEVLHQFAKDEERERSNTSEGNSESVFFHLFPTSCDFIGIAKRNREGVENLLASKEARGAFMSHLESSLSVSRELSRALIIVKEFYDMDLLEEEDIVLWCSNSVGSGEMKKQLLPILKWFEEAEEESGEDS